MKGLDQWEDRSLGGEIYNSICVNVRELTLSDTLLDDDWKTRGSSLICGTWILPRCCLPVWFLCLNLPVYCRFLGTFDVHLRQHKVRSHCRVTRLTWYHLHRWHWSRKTQFLPSSNNQVQIHYSSSNNENSNLKWITLYSPSACGGLIGADS